MRSLVFGAWNLFGVWCLGFGVFSFPCFSTSTAVTYPLRWRWSNPTPHGNNVINMAFLYAPPTQRAVQVTERGQIYTSEDLILWTPRDSGATNALRGVTFFNVAGTNRIVIVGEEGKVLSEVQRGYMLHDRVLRPAMVVVGKGITETSEQGGQPS